MFYIVFRSDGAYENFKSIYKIMLKIESEVSEDIILTAISYNNETLIQWVFIVLKSSIFI